MSVDLKEVEARLPAGSRYGDATEVTMLADIVRLLRALRETRAALRVMLLNRDPKQDLVDDARQVLWSVLDD